MVAYDELGSLVPIKRTLQVIDYQNQANKESEILKGHKLEAGNLPCTGQPNPCVPTCTPQSKQPACSVSSLTPATRGLKACLALPCGDPGHSRP
ncbi:hypothetical protein INR49_000215 [Caranx melampygus]|nr:hypothetical protein INR49_000215 [Caranx melampygus]